VIGGGWGIALICPSDIFSLREKGRVVGIGEGEN